MNLQAWRDLVEKKGGKMAPPDHPIYSEGPSITFLSHTNEQSEPLTRVQKLPDGSPDPNPTRARTFILTR